MATQVRSHAKINLGLYLGAPRADGFHSLVTVYQTLALHDVVTVTARLAGATAIGLTSNDGRVPADGRNTAWKMVELALEALGVCAEVEIHIDKRLPVQGGLGAGSANAVAALVGLEAELAELAGWRGGDAGPSTPLRFAQDDSLVGERSAQDDSSVVTSRVPEERGGLRVGVSHPSHKNKSAARVGHPAPLVGLEGELAGSAGLAGQRVGGARWLEIAAQVGSDVPLFLVGGTVLGLDRGQQVSPLPDIEPTWCVVAVPSVGVSTAQAFRDWDALAAAEGLTRQASTDKLSELSRAYVSAFAEPAPSTGSIQEGRQGACSSGVPAVAGDLAGPQESALVRTGISSWIQNDFERVVFPQHPSLAEIKRLLAGSGTAEAACPRSSILASLSGSGSALFGLYQTLGAAEAARERVLAQTEGVACFLTRTLPRADYWREMLEFER